MQAIIWMLVTLASFCLMAIGIRELSGDIPVFQMLLIRSSVGLLLITSLFMATKQFSQTKSKHIKLHVFRNVFHFAGQYGWYLGIGLLPLAEVFALEFTVPIWTAIIAALFLKEKLSFRKLVAIGLGFIGVLLIVRPGIGIIDSASFIVLGAATAYAVAHSSTKALTAYDKPTVILFFMCVIQTPIAMIFTWGSWVEPNLSQWFWLLMIAVTALSAHYCMAKAMQFAEVTTIVTIDFIRLPLIAVLGVILYQEAFEFTVLLGGALMLIGNLINVRGLARRVAT